MGLTALELAKILREEQEHSLRWAGQHFDTMDDGHFSAIAINDKECVLQPFPEFGGYIYRGQRQYYEPCRSSLHRNRPNKIERLIEKIRQAEFEMLISNHPAVIDFSNSPDWSIVGLRCKIDYEGLAQHYGLKTELIDFTSNPFVAAFFACCEYDRESNKWRPIEHGCQDGIIYKYNQAFDMAEEQEEPCSFVVGLQPLPRPAAQYAWCYRLPKRASLNSQRFVSHFSFVHEPKVSTKIFERFEGGEKLFPNDPVSNKAIEIAKANRLSRNAFNLAFSKYKQNKTEKILNNLSRKGIQIVNNREIIFSESEILEIQREWNERRYDLISRIHWRMACYPI